MQDVFSNWNLKDSGRPCSPLIILGTVEGPLILFSLGSGNRKRVPVDPLSLGRFTAASHGNAAACKAAVQR